MNPHYPLQVAGLLPVQLAANKAVTAQKTNQLHTKGLHSELIFNLSGSKHVRLSCLAWLA